MLLERLGEHEAHAGGDQERLDRVLADVGFDLIDHLGRVGALQVGAGRIEGIGGGARDLV